MPEAENPFAFPTSTEQQRVEEIVGKLTTKQREVLLALPENGWRRPKDVGASGRTMNSLWDMWTGEYGLSQPIQLVHRDVCDSPLCHIWELSALGLAVRAILKDSPNV